MIPKKLTVERTMKEEIKLHITYDEELKLGDLAECLSKINTAINDVNRDNGMKDSRKIGSEYASKVQNVESGSIIVFITVNIVTPVALSVIANYIYDKLKGFKKKKKKSNEEHNIEEDSIVDVRVVEENDKKEISIHISSHRRID